MISAIFIIVFEYQRNQNTTQRRVFKKKDAAATEKWKNIYEAPGFWIAETYIKSYYVVTSSQAAAAFTTAVRITPEECRQIIESSGDAELVMNIISNRGFVFTARRNE